MALHKTKTIDPANVDDNGIAEAQTLSGSGNVSLDGALVSGGVFTDTYGRRISITSVGDDSGLTFTVTGTNQDDRATTEAISGVASTAATSDIYFKGVTIIASDGATADDITVGTVDEVVTNTIPLDHYNSDPADVSIEQVTGTVNITVEETFSDIQEETDPEFFSVTALASKTAATRSPISNHATGVRFKVNSYTDGADFKGVVVQNRPR